jgi:hypothetical protein
MRTGRIPLLHRQLELRAYFLFLPSSLRYLSCEIAASNFASFCGRHRCFMGNRKRHSTRGSIHRCIKMGYCLRSYVSICQVSPPETTVSLRCSLQCCRDVMSALNRGDIMWGLGEGGQSFDCTALGFVEERDVPPYFKALPPTKVTLQTQTRPLSRLHPSLPTTCPAKRCPDTFLNCFEAIT